MPLSSCSFRLLERRIALLKRELSTWSLIKYMTEGFRILEYGRPLEDWKSSQRKQQTELDSPKSGNPNFAATLRSSRSIVGIRVYVRSRMHDRHARTPKKNNNLHHVFFQRRPHVLVIANTGSRKPQVKYRLVSDHGTWAQDRRTCGTNCGLQVGEIQDGK